VTERYSHVTTAEKFAAVNRLVEVVAPDKEGP